jgi:hypothetical protein
MRDSPRQPDANLAQLERDGFIILPSVFTAAESDAANRQLTDAISNATGDLSIRTRSNTIYAARNVTEWFPQASRLWQKEQLVRVLRAVLGSEFGLVRVLFFDKPPEQPWSLPWHKDMTIAVQRNDLPSDRFRNPTTKAGIKHVEAPTGLLQRMLTLRLHLDDVDEDNGPLIVIPRSHRTGKEASTDETIEKILANCGDVLAIRPLVAHSSPVPSTGTTRRRRVLHFEFAADRELDDGYAWRMFLREGGQGTCSRTSDY